MKQSAFLDDLRRAGVVVVDATKHYKLYYSNGKQTTCPRHPSKEISNAFAKKIMRQLGIK